MRKLFTFTRGPTNRTRTAAALAAVGALVMSGGVVMLAASPAANADPEIHKSYVCKWIAKPHEAERLQTGDNPIWIDNNAIKGYDGTSPVKAGDEFVDGQDKSVVLIANTPKLNPEPGIASCFKSIPVPAMPEVVDPCNERGVVSNNYFVVPSDSGTLDWTLLSSGDVTVAPQFGYKFPTDSQLVTFELPADKGVMCDSTVTIDPPSAPATADPCGPSNIHFVGYADTAQLDYTLLENGNVTVKPQPGYVFTGPTQLVTFVLPADSGVPCPSDVTIAPPGAPSTTDPCGPANISFNVPADTAQFDYTLLANGDVTVAPQLGYVFSGPTQLVTFTLPADSGVPCPLAAEEIEPVVTFTDPTCKALDGADWSGTFESIVRYSVTGKADLGESIVVTASIKPAYVGEYVFPDGFDAAFEHTYPTLAELDCVLGEETVVPSPKPEQKPPVVLGTEAAVPTGVNAGLAGLPETGSTSHTLLAQLMVASGLVLLVAGGWLGFGRREYGGHQI